MMGNDINTSMMDFIEYIAHTVSLYMEHIIVGYKAWVMSLSSTANKSITPYVYEFNPIRFYYIASNWLMLCYGDP